MEIIFHYTDNSFLYPINLAEPRSSVGGVADWKTGRWFNRRLGQYSFRELMIVIATGFIPLLPLSIVSTMVMGVEKNIVQSTG